MNKDTLEASDGCVAAAANIFVVPTSDWHSSGLCNQTVIKVSERTLTMPKVNESFKWLVRVDEVHNGRNVIDAHLMKGGISRGIGTICKPYVVPI